MTDLSSDQRADKIVRSLKENSAAFIKQQRARETARIRMILWNCFLFASGAAVGALLTLAL